MTMIERYDDAALLNGHRVAVIGIYTQTNLNKRPGGAPTYGGRVHLALQDRREVMLEVGDAGVRDKTEIERFLGKRVRVEGVFDAHCLAWGDGKEASIVGPCLREITVLSLIE